MLSQTVEYALRAAVYLADQSPDARTTDQIAEVTVVPSAYLSKVLQSLSRAGLVRSQRGVRGGFTLARSPESLTILDIVSAVDPIRRIRECPIGVKPIDDSLCALHARIDSALASVEELFGKTTLSAIVEQRPQVVPLCELHRGDNDLVQSSPFGNL